jgi:hypothetical protein
MEPIQLWLPDWGPSLGFPVVWLDVQQAVQQWRGEGTVWFLPWVNTSYRWVHPAYRSARGGPIPMWAFNLAIPARHFERVDVYHIGDDGDVWGPGSSDRFPKGRVDGLLTSWLNDPEERYDFCRAPQSAVMVPVFDGKKGAYQMMSPPPERIGAIVPADQRRISWPPEGSPLPCISIEAETWEYYGYHETESEEYVTPIIVQGWTEPLASLLPFGSGIDTAFRRAHMARLARRSVDDLDSALAEAEQAASLSIAGGFTTRALAWFWPRNASLMRHMQGVPASRLERMLREEAQSRFRIQTEADFAQIMRERIGIRRAWGVLGLFWTLLLDQLRERWPFRTCERCGRIIVGRRVKRFCAAADDLQCFRQRGVARQRKARA